MEWRNKKMLEFVDDYHNAEELWNNKIPSYKDLRKKLDKMKELSKKYNCTVAEIKKRIKNLRSAFHREHKKLKQKSGSSPSKKAKWFAYEQLKFLLDVDLPKSTLSTAGSDEEDIKVKHGEDAEIVNDEQSTVPTTSLCSSASCGSIKVVKSPLKVKSKRNLEDHRAEEAYAILKNFMEKDESTVFGEYVASKHRKYSGYTRNVIEHLINSVLYDADMGKYDGPGAARNPNLRKICKTSGNCNNL